MSGTLWSGPEWISNARPRKSCPTQRSLGCPDDLSALDVGWRVNRRVIAAASITPAMRIFRGHASPIWLRQGPCAFGGAIDNSPDRVPASGKGRHNAAGRSGDHTSVLVWAGSRQRTGPLFSPGNPAKLTLAYQRSKLDRTAIGETIDQVERRRGARVSTRRRQRNLLTQVAIRLGNRRQVVKEMGG
jgi:hypothetical protein